MDANPAGLPPITPQVPAPAPGGFQPLPPRPVATPGVVGRPSLDPERQEQRVEKSRTTARLENLMPQRAKDVKLQVFATSGGRPRGKPVLTLLAADIETQLGPQPDVNALDDMISSALPDKYPDGTYKCQWFDRTNRAMSEPPAWDIDIGDAEGQDDDDGGRDDDDGQDDQRTMPVQVAFPQPVPAAPAPPSLDLAGVGSALRQERQEESRRGSEMMTLVVSMQNMAQQTMAQMQAQQQQQQAQQQQWQREAEERERARRAEFRQTLMAMLPLVLPMIQTWMAPKTSGPSPEMSALLELVKGMATNKSSDVMVLEKMMEFQGKMAERQMDIQAKGAGTAVEMQAKATGMVFDNMLSTMKKLMDNKQEPEKEGGMMDTIGRLAGPFLANMAQAQNQQPAPEMPPAPAAPQQRAPRPVAPKTQPPPAPPLQPAPAPAAEEPAPEAGRRTGRRAQRVAPAQPPFDPKTVPDIKRTEGCLKAIRGLSLGNPAPEKRWDVVQWIAGMLPDDLMAAVKVGDINKAIELGTGAALSNATILQWIGDDENQTFLKAVLEDVKLLALGQVTPEIAEASLIKGGAFVQRRAAARAQLDRQAEEAMRRHNNPPDAGEAPKPVVDGAVVTDATSAIAPAAAPVQDAVIPPKSTKVPPPAQQN